MTTCFTNTYDYVLRPQCVKLQEMEIEILCQDFLVARGHWAGRIVSTCMLNSPSNGKWLPVFSVINVTVMIKKCQLRFKFTQHQQMQGLYVYDADHDRNIKIYIYIYNCVHYTHEDYSPVISVLHLFLLSCDFNLFIFHITYWPVYLVWKLCLACGTQKHLSTIPMG